MSYKITDEQKKALLQYSAQTLPDNPSREGFSAESIRKRMYKPIEKLIDLVNSVFDTAYTDVKSIITAIQSGDLFARSVASWSASYTYGADEITFYPSIGTYGAFVQSVVAGNTNNAPYVDGAINSAYWKEVVNFNNIAEDYFQQVQAAVAQAESAASDAAKSARSAQESASAAASSAEQAVESEETINTLVERAEQAADEAEAALNDIVTNDYVGKAEQAANDAKQSVISAGNEADRAESAADKAEQVVAGIGTVYKPQGSLAFASLPAQPAEQYQGFVWNITDTFVTDNRFLEGAGQDVAAGANVACVYDNGQYKYDLLGNFIDVSKFSAVVDLGTFNKINDNTYTKALSTEIQNALKENNIAMMVSVIKESNTYKFTFCDYIRMVNEALLLEATILNVDDRGLFTQLELSVAESAATFKISEVNLSNYYIKPSTGIPKTDLASAVQTSLNKADTALQSVPIATSSKVGGVKPTSKTTQMTQAVGVDSNGALWTAPANGGIEQNEVIAVKSLPAATADSPDFVQTLDGKLYRKKYTQTVDDSVIGIYRFNDNADRANGVYNLDFTSNGKSFTSIEIDSEAAFIRYNNSDGSRANAFEGSWVEEYRIITVTNVLPSNVSVVQNLLTNYAVKQPSTTYSYEEVGAGAAVEYMTDAEVDALFLPPIPSFAEATWEQIAKVSELKVAQNYFKVGDEKVINLSTGKQITLVILGFDHDDLSDGSGKANISIGMKNLSSSRFQMENSTSNAGGWDKCNIRTSAIPTLILELPSDLQAVIKQVNKKATEGSKSTNIVTSVDKLWLFSIAEIYSAKAIENASTSSYHDIGNYVDIYKQEGSQYEYYKNLIGDDGVSDNPLLIKKLNDGNGSAMYWWLRSPAIGFTYLCYLISNDGACEYDRLTFEYGISFGFCI